MQSAGAIEYTNSIFSESSVYDIKQSDGEDPVIMEIWGMWNTPSLPSLSGSLWLGVVAPDSVLSWGQIELFDI